jgi:D-sedoheptulose 7-phosphate isomerase
VVDGVCRHVLCWSGTYRIDKLEPIEDAFEPFSRMGVHLDTSSICDGLLLRNEISATFFRSEARILAEMCRETALRFQQGGRLLAIGRGPYSTDAQHVSVEFVHPVIVGKRALPAVDVSAYPRESLQAIVRGEDVVMGFGPPGGDPDVETLIAAVKERGALTFSCPGRVGDYAMPALVDDVFIHQEIVEILYHTLWETVHVFLEHREMGHDVGPSQFLYPFLGASVQDTQGVVEDVARSIEAKASDDEVLRRQAAVLLSDRLGEAAVAVTERLRSGGKIVAFGNGGSATDANDFVFDCCAPPATFEPVPAVSLSLEAANVTAVANDVGAEAIFLRQLIALSGVNDVVVAFSTSGSSRNVVLALEEARSRGLRSLAFVGCDGGEIVRRSLADFPFVVSCDYVPRIQEIHASLYHTLRETLEAVRT